MRNSKGMSQTLALIVSATVLLMAALAVIFLTSDTIGNFGASSRGQGCVSTVEAQCAVKGRRGTVDVPGSCTTEGEPTDAVPSEWGVENSESEIECSTVDN